MVFDKFKQLLTTDKAPSKNSNTNIKFGNIKELTEEQKKTRQELISEKREYLKNSSGSNENPMTREEVIEAIQKEIQSSNSSTNPFKTKEDRMFYFFNSKMKLAKAPMPFEEIMVGGKVFFVNKHFENGAITIKELFASPDLEINLEEEYKKKGETQKRLSKLNKYLTYIETQRSKGNEKYNLIDTKDLKEKKYELEKILDSIKYGKIAEFEFECIYTRKNSYWMKYSNGEYKYLKITENNFIAQENNVRFLKGYEIRKRLEDIANFRIEKNWKQIFTGVLVFIGAILMIFAFYKLMTFDETLFDKRVQDYCGEQKEHFNILLADAKDYKCELERKVPSFEEVK